MTTFRFALLFSVFLFFSNSLSKNCFADILGQGQMILFTVEHEVSATNPPIMGTFKTESPTALLSLETCGMLNDFVQAEDSPVEPFCISYNADPDPVASILKAKDSGQFRLHLDLKVKQDGSYVVHVEDYLNQEEPENRSISWTIPATADPLAQKSELQNHISQLINFARKGAAAEKYDLETPDAQNVVSSDEDPIIDVDVPFSFICEKFKALSQSSKPIPTEDEVKVDGKQTDSFTVSKKLLKSCNKMDFMARLAGKSNKKAPVFIIRDQHHRRWRFRFFMGFTRVMYGKTEATIKTSRLDLTISDLQPYERTSDGAYRNFFHETLAQEAQIVDEPTNTFTFILVKNKNEIVLKIFHPKFIFAEGDQDFNGHQYYNDNVLVHGTADGQPVNGRMPLRGVFGPDHQLLANHLGFVAWEDSHKLLQPEAGYGHTFTLVKDKGKPVLTYTPEVTVGIYLGEKNASYIGKSHYEYDYQYYGNDSNSNADLGIMGYSASLSQRLDFTNKKDFMGVFVEHKASFGEMDYDMMDGKVQHKMQYMSLTAGITLRFGIKKKKHRTVKHQD